jgi:hypothetical protein
MDHFLGEDPRGKNSRAVKMEISGLIKFVTEEFLTPPFSQIRISSQASGFSDGKNQKYRELSLLAAESIGMRPA